MRSIGKAFGVILAALFSAAAARAEVPLVDFARAPQFRDIKISPEGDYLAASAVVDGKAVLSLIRLDGMKGVNLRPRDLDEIADFWWAAPHRLLYSVSQKTGGLEQPLATGELFAVNADGGSQKMLAGFRVKGNPVIVTPILPLFSDDRRVLVSVQRWAPTLDGAYPTAAWLDLDSGSVANIVTAPMRNAQFVADNDGDVRFASAQGTDQAWRVHYREKKGDWQLLFDESKHDFGGFPMRFGRSGGEVYFKCAGSRGVDGVCRWNVAARTFSKLWSDGEAGPAADQLDRFGRTRGETAGGDVGAISRRRRTLHQPHARRSQGRRVGRGGRRSGQFLFVRRAGAQSVVPVRADAVDQAGGDEQGRADDTEST